MEEDGTESRCSRSPRSGSVDSGEAAQAPPLLPQGSMPPWAQASSRSTPETPGREQPAAVALDEGQDLTGAERLMERVRVSLQQRQGSQKSVRMPLDLWAPEPDEPGPILQDVPEEQKAAPSAELPEIQPVGRVLPVNEENRARTLRRVRTSPEEWNTNRGTSADLKKNLSDIFGRQQQAVADALQNVQGLTRAGGRAEQKVHLKEEDDLSPERVLTLERSANLERPASFGDHVVRVPPAAPASERRNWVSLTAPAGRTSPRAVPARSSSVKRMTSAGTGQSPARSLQVVPYSPQCPPGKERGQHGLPASPPARPHSVGRRIEMLR